MTSWPINWLNWVTTFRTDRRQLFTLWTCRQLDVQLSWVAINRALVSLLITTKLLSAHTWFREQFVTYAWQMARHCANYASPCRLERLRAAKMARLGTPHYGAQREQNSCQCEACLTDGIVNDSWRWLAGGGARRGSSTGPPAPRPPSDFMMVAIDRRWAELPAFDRPRPSVEDWWFTRRVNPIPWRETTIGW